MKHKKFIAFVLLIAVLSVSLTTLIACNKNDDDSNPTNNASELESKLNSFLAYGENNNYAHYWVQSNCYTDNEYYDNEYGKGFKWKISGYFEDGNDQSIRVYLYQYDTEENAKSAYSTFFDSGKDPDYPAKRYGNAVIETKTLGIYDAIKASALPESVSTSTVYKYAIKTLRSRISSYSELIWTYDCCNGYEDLMGVTTQMQTTAPNSNCVEIFSCSTMLMLGEDIEDEIGTEYTTDSYSKVENNINYFYVKDMPGFRFEPTEDGNGYAITDYYYDNTNGTIVCPTEYKGKPITEISQGGLYYMPKEIKEIIISDTITKIGDSAFKECIGLKKIIIPQNVLEIGISLFQGDISLETVFCEASSKPAGWADNWNSGYPIVWGYRV